MKMLLTLSVLALPIVIMITENAMKNIPDSVREVAFTLWAKQWQSALLVVFSAAFSKIMTGVVLANVWIAGETVSILFTDAIPYLAYLSSRT